MPPEFRSGDGPLRRNYPDGHSTVDYSPMPFWRLATVRFLHSFLSIPCDVRCYIEQLTILYLRSTSRKTIRCGKTSIVFIRPFHLTICVRSNPSYYPKLDHSYTSKSDTVRFLHTRTTTTCTFCTAGLKERRPIISSSYILIPLDPRPTLPSLHPVTRWDESVGGWAWSVTDSSAPQGAYYRSCKEHYIRGNGARHQVFFFHFYAPEKHQHRGPWSIPNRTMLFNKI